MIEKIKKVLDESQNNLDETEKLFLAHFMAGIIYSNRLVRNLFYAQAKIFAVDAIGILKRMGENNQPKKIGN